MRRNWKCRKCCCLYNNINTYAFALKDPMNIYKAIMGENVGTETHN